MQRAISSPVRLPRTEAAASNGSLKPSVNRLNRVLKSNEGSAIRAHCASASPC
jgi:hypothetical protein